MASLNRYRIPPCLLLSFLSPRVVDLGNPSEQGEYFTMWTSAILLNIHVLLLSFLCTVHVCFCFLFRWHQIWYALFSRIYCTLTVSCYEVSVPNLEFSLGVGEFSSNTESSSICGCSLKVWFAIVADCDTYFTYETRWLFLVKKIWDEVNLILVDGMLLFYVWTIGVVFWLLSLS